MKGLLDYIFGDLEKISDNRSQIIAYLNYLNEILSQNPKPEDKKKYLAAKKQLEARLQELHVETAKKHPGS